MVIFVTYACATLPNANILKFKIREIVFMEAFICDGVRTPIGRYGGALSSVRTDDLGASVLVLRCNLNAQRNAQRVRPLSRACATLTASLKAALLLG